MKLRFNSLFWAQLLLVPLIVFSSFSGCEKEEEDIYVDNPETNDSIPWDKPEIEDSVQMPEPEVAEYVLYNNLGTKNWTYLAAVSSGEIMLIKEDSTGDFSAAKFIDGMDTVYCKTENSVDKATLTLNSRDYTLSLVCSGETVVLFQNDGDVIGTFPLAAVLKSTRALISNRQMANIMFGEAVGKLLDMIPGVSDIIKALETMKLLYETDDMYHHDKVDYIADEGYKLFPTDIFGPEEVEKTAPTYFIGIHTGDAEVNGLTAKCYIAGYLRAEANDGEFDFDYGICLSTSSNPSLSDKVQKHTAVSGMINSIDVDLSLPYTFGELKNNTTYYYRAYFKNNLDGRVEYADEIKSFKTENMLCPDDNHPHAIDLGLPSGTKWACCNVGASSPEGYGGYYAWGETEEKSKYTYENYKYWIDMDGDGSVDTNEIQNLGSDISGTQYDVAHVKWGGSWRMPTVAECQELVDKCTWTWTTQGGHNGYKVTGPNGNSIFLPAAGARFSWEWESDSLDFAGECGYYLSSSPYGHDEFGLYFDSSSHSVYWTPRGGGRSVRPVSE